MQAAIILLCEVTFKDLHKRISALETTTQEHKILDYVINHFGFGTSKNINYKMLAKKETAVLTTLSGYP